MCLAGADETTYLKAERHLEQTGGISVSGRQIQRVIQRVGGAAQPWQERPTQPGDGPRCDAPTTSKTTLKRRAAFLQFRELNVANAPRERELPVILENDCIHKKCDD